MVITTVYRYNATSELYMNVYIIWLLARYSIFYPSLEPEEPHPQFTFCRGCKCDPVVYSPFNTLITYSLRHVGLFKTLHLSLSFLSHPTKKKSIHAAGSLLFLVYETMER